MSDGWSRQELARQLRDLGLGAGAKVLVHSSLSSLGRVDGGAETVVDALLDVISPEGTLIVPTLTGSEDVGPRHELRFDPASDAGWTGIIPETVRRRPEAVRSLHPTHSVAAIGADAASITAGHEDCITPCGPGSPYLRLAEDPRGCVLLLGVGHESNTTLHAVEELSGSPFHLQREPVHASIRTATTVIRRTFWAHAYGTPRRFGAIEPLLVERGIQTSGPVGAATARLMRSGALVELGREVLRASPEFFVAESE